MILVIQFLLQIVIGLIAQLGTTNNRNNYTAGYVDLLTAKRIRA